VVILAEPVMAFVLLSGGTASVRSFVTDKTARSKGFSARRGIMSALRFLAPSVSVLFGLYCVIWGLVASSASTAYRLDGVFFGVLLLLLALVYLRVIPPARAGGDRAL
jgi:hypothetical protein